MQWEREERRQKKNIYFVFLQQIVFIEHKKNVLYHLRRGAELIAQKKKECLWQVSAYLDF